MTSVSEQLSAKEQEADMLFVCLVPFVVMPLLEVQRRRSEMLRRRKGGGSKPFRYGSSALLDKAEAAEGGQRAPLDRLGRGS